MRHRKDTKIFGRESASRGALFRGLATNLFLSGIVVTTQQKAKELQRTAEHILTLAGKATTVRKAQQYLYTKEARRALMEKWVPAISQRKGGYTRVTKMRQRKGDGAAMAKIEILE